MFKLIIGALPSSYDYLLTGLKYSKKQAFPPALVPISIPFASYLVKNWMFKPYIKKRQAKRALHFHLKALHNRSYQTKYNLFC
jgi:hypothetical protein